MLTLKVRPPKPEHAAGRPPPPRPPSSPSPPAAVAARCTCAARPRACPVPTCRFDPLGAAALHATTGSPAIELSACLSLITHPPERRRGTVRRNTEGGTANSSRHSSLSSLRAREAHARQKPSRHSACKHARARARAPPPATCLAIYIYVRTPPTAPSLSLCPEPRAARRWLAHPCPICCPTQISLSGSCCARSGGRAHGGASPSFR